ncbi:MAG TPA: TIM44-like domain-containing protein [Stellaceae bacterium]|jgi:predicted lipid-binding transport protein (Tim44 family)|nr:TIM44-like domain-containing protein [Stellaceae bacterium]
MTQHSKRWRVILALLFSLTLALAPSLAEARAGSSYGGGGSSFGSRGSRSFEGNGASPLSRTMQTPSAGYGAGAGYAAGGGSFFSRHPFLTGIFGGFLGSMLFGGGFFGHMFGGFFSILLIGLLIFFVFRLLSGAFAGGGGGFAPRSVGAAAAPAQQRYRGRDTYVGDADLNAFQSLHAAVQEAWGRGDLARMRQLMTPEMLSYFSEELTKNSSQGVENHVSNVTLVKAELTESWEEGDLEYATAYMRWTAIDYTVRAGAAPSSPGALVSGDPRIPTEAEEVWTFVRRRGGQWLLSAIQQV